jgi:hypothetical protein
MQLIQGCPKIFSEDAVVSMENVVAAIKESARDSATHVIKACNIS